MIALLLGLVPLLGAIACAFIRRPRTTGVLIAVGLVNSALAAYLAFASSTVSTPSLHGYVVTDSTTRLFALLINLVFLGVAGHTWTRVRAVPELRSRIERFSALVLAFVAAANLAVVSNHLLGGWLFLETTSLVAAPLVARSGSPASLRASWRYFLFSSVGLALTLLGFGCLWRSLETASVHPTFFLDGLRTLLSAPADPWREIGLIFVILGYGTKLGLAPMYVWLPETYDEAPPSVTALLAGVQFNCALVGLIRVLQVYRAGDPALASLLLVSMGLISMGVSTFSIIATHNYKRLLAYGSINHAGVIAIGLGIGGSASYGLALYVVSNAFIKVILFLTAGKIDDHYKTKDMREVAGLIKDLPVSGLFLMVGTFALLGFPPFGSFLGELIILSGLMRGGYVSVFVAFCSLLTMTFVATGRSVFPMIWGTPKHAVSWPRQGFFSSPFKFIFIAALVGMGVFLPRPVNALFIDVAASLGGR